MENNNSIQPEFFQVSSFQLLKLKHLHCDDLNSHNSIFIRSSNI